MQRNRLTLPLTMVCILMLAGPPALQAQSARKKVAEGNKYYGEEKYDEAGNSYQDALLSDPASPLIAYNMGSALYKKNNFEKAGEFFQKSLDADDVLQQSKSYYNLGNTLYRQQKFAESIEAYKEALKLNPEDEDAKFNLEFVRNKLKDNAESQNQDQQNQEQQDQQEKQDQQGQNQQDQQEQQKQQQQEQQQQEQQQQEQQEQNQDQQQSEQDQNQQDQQRQEQQSQQEEKTEMSPEEARQLLDALTEDQKEKLTRKMKTSGRSRVSKDW